MNALYGLPKEMLQKICEHCESIATVAAMASINKKFYKSINRDFKAMCQQNGVYRFDGETWAIAFSLAQFRAFEFAKSDVFNCQTTGKVVFPVWPHYALISHIDFSMFKFKMMDFKQHFAEHIDRIRFINNGTQLLIVCKWVLDTDAFEQPAYLFDLTTQKVLKKFRLTHFHQGMYIELKENDRIYDPFTDKEFQIPSEMEFVECKYTDRHSEQRYIPMLARSREEFYIRDMKTDETFKLCNVTARSFDHCFLEDLDFVYIKNEANGRYGYNNVQIYDLKTKERVFERSYIKGKDNWSCISNYAIQNMNTGECILYNPKKEQFYSTVTRCLSSESHRHKYQEGVCDLTACNRGEGRRRFAQCFDDVANDQATFFLDHIKDKLRMMPLAVDRDETRYMDDICYRCDNYLCELQSYADSSTNLNEEMKKFFISELKYLKNRETNNRHDIKSRVL
ncbi:unnamed protein product [Bursaphelenchus okinawaensis]|uniref:F-box domain-containing protein n=1 Tax=Bursaphelenchus okinawaensis TaxID=465554 RepID=A0A811KDB4_9BILA|nr:unnamed protein product [Bursaphelenchus okinawaensis]CAG9102209.1 unnamed protein product [Bursaphelenchus okinawaensis]